MCKGKINGRNNYGISTFKWVEFAFLYEGMGGGGGHSSYEEHLGHNLIYTVMTSRTGHMTDLFTITCVQ